MITQKDIILYKGITLNRGDGFLYIPPDSSLRPYISCYTITFPTDMPDTYTILPTASSTIVMSVIGNNIIGGLRGVNTKACTVGEYANKMSSLLLIEFRPGCLYPFIKINQFELADNSIALSEVDNNLARMIEIEMHKAVNIENLVRGLDHLFLARLTDNIASQSVAAMVKTVSMRNGNTSTRDLSSKYFYSEKHIRRLFMKHVGASPKEFSRIIRVNYALRIIQNNCTRLSDVAAHARYFDQSHLIRDFKMICGVTPQQYMQNMSVFYNDEYKV